MEIAEAKKAKLRNTNIAKTKDVGDKQTYEQKEDTEMRQRKGCNGF